MMSFIALVYWVGVLFCREREVENAKVFFQFLCVLCVLSRLKGSSCIFPGQETVPQKLIRLIARLRQKPIATARDAIGFDLGEVRVEAVAIQRADGVGFGVEVAGTFGFKKSGGGQRRQVNLLRVREVEAHHVETRTAEKIDGFPETLAGVEEVAQHGE